MSDKDTFIMLMALLISFLLGGFVGSLEFEPSEIEQEPIAVEEEVEEIVFDEAWFENPANWLKTPTEIEEIHNRRRAIEDARKWIRNGVME